MTSPDEPIEHDLIRTGTAAEFGIVETKVEPSAAGDDTVVRIVLRLPEDDVEVFSFGLIYVIGVLSFHDGRPRGVSGKWFDDDDQWTAADMLAGLTFPRGRLYWHADYVRGRCMKTTVEVSPDGTVLLETVARGEAALRWLDRLEGKKYLQAVEVGRAVGKFTKRLSRGARKQAAQGKLSTRLVEFAQPIIDALQGEAGALTQEQLRNAYMIAATSWNCQVLEQWGRGSELADRARADLDAVPKTPEFAELVDETLDRKAKMFPDDIRVISDFDVRHDGKGGFRVVAEGRLAWELMDEH